LGIIGKVDCSRRTITASKQANKLAKRYIEEGAFPKGSVTDARHVAVATVNSLDKVVSLNFRHIVRERVIELTGAINTLFGYLPVKIVTPMEMIDYEKTRYHTG